MAIKLKIQTQLGDPQRTFESAACELGLNHGIFAIAPCETKYVNSHVQWLWVQWKKAHGYK